MLEADWTKQGRTCVDLLVIDSGMGSMFIAESSHEILLSLKFNNKHKK